MTNFKEKVFLKFKTLDPAFQAFKEEVFLKLRALTSHVENLRKQLEKLIWEFSQFQAKLAHLNKHFESANKELEEKTKSLSKELSRAKAKLSEDRKQLKQNKTAGSWLRQKRRLSRMTKPYRLLKSNCKV